MRVGLVRNVGLSAVALLAFGMTGCDDNPLDFDTTVAVLLTANPTAMVMVAGTTTLLESRTLSEGGQPTWDDIDWSLDATCGAAQPSLAVAATYIPELQPPGVFDVSAGDIPGDACIVLEGGGVSKVVTLHVNPAVPIISAVAPASGDFSQIVTLTGENFFEQTAIFVNGIESILPPTFVSSTELTFLMTTHDGLGIQAISAGTTGGNIRSNELDYEVVAGFTNGTTEPANDDPGTAPSLTLPIVLNDGISAVDFDDLFLVAGSGATEVFARLDWDTASDLDFYILDSGLNATCTSWYLKPEGTSCADGGSGAVAGDFYIYVNYFSGPDAVYSLHVKEGVEPPAP